MFEIEQMDNEFDYSLVDNETANFLRSCEYEMNGIAEDARVKFGGVLKRAQDKLAKGGYGVFIDWVKSGGVSKDDAYYYIELNRLSINLERQKTDNFLNAPKSLQKETMKKNAPEDLKQKVYDGDITTNKQYQEEMQARKQAEQQAEQYRKQAENAKHSEQVAIDKLEEEQQKEPEIKEVTKEVVPESVQETLDNAKKQLNEVTEENERLKQENEKFKNGDASEFDEEKEEREKRMLEIEAEKNVLRLKIKVDEFLEEVAISAFMEGAIASSGKSTKEKLEQSVDELKSFTNKMETTLKGRVEI